MYQQAGKSKSEIFFLTVFGETFFLLIALANFFLSKHQQYRYLAESLLQGKTYFVTQPMTWGDTSPYNGHYYWPLGPLPALILVPFVFVWKTAGYTFYQGYLSFFLALWTTLLCFQVARTLKYSKIDSIWWAFAFCFSTSFLTVAVLSWSWYFAHVIAVCLLFLAVHEYLGKQRWWLIGITVALAAATRLPIGLSIFFFVATASVSSSRRTKALVALCLPFGVVILLLAFYNVARFDSFLESGYSYQMLNEQESGLGTGLLDFGNISSHFSRFLFGVPFFSVKFPFVRPDHLGMSVFIVSPFLVYLVSLRKWDSTAVLLAISITIILFAVLAFRSTGFRQLGYRFSLDFMPLLFLLLMRNGFRGERLLSLGFKHLVLLGSLVDLFLTAIFVVQLT